MTLAEFLRARLDEDEQAAQALDGARWWAATNVGDEYNYGVVQDHEPEAERYAYGERIASCGVEGLDDGDHRAAHIARHDPARVLAEVAAKRRIVELHDGAHECSTFERDGEVDNCTWCLDAEDCSTMRLLALPHAEHPEYRQEWKP